MVALLLLTSPLWLSAFYGLTHALKAWLWPAEKPVEPVEPITRPEPIKWPIRIVWGAR
jgi:hypothetical protein